MAVLPRCLVQAPYHLLSEYRAPIHQLSINYVNELHSRFPVDSEVSTLIIRTSQVELVSQGQAPIKGLHLSLLAARPMLAFRSILIPGLERWTPPALPGLWKPHRSRIPIPGRPVRKVMLGCFTEVRFARPQDEHVLS
ncbi:hypothetical protein Fot_49030 [Forsythia ovata]|uniref:Uncharacterized protein n=1 Tax=Forsythia ovata TaxID=205694 RepID=A0ABD1QBP2_9LAMI